MSSFKCKPCETEWPEEALLGRACPICASGTFFKPDGDPDGGWELKLARHLNPPDEDPAFRWRFGQLMNAGYSPAQAELMALNRDIDLHRAMRMGETAGHDLAYSILT